MDRASVRWVLAFIIAWLLVLVVAPAHGQNATVVALKADGSISVPADFWALRQYHSTMTNPNVTTLWDATPATVTRTDAGCDSTNYTAGLQYSSSGISSPLLFNFTQMGKFLESTHAKWIFCVGGEINNAGSAANQVRYIEGLGLHPTWWSIGNEPSGWDHFNIPYASWTVNDVSAPTPHEYAVLVQNYTKAMLSVDQHLKFIGLQSGAAATQEGPWVSAVEATDGPNISAIALHLYVDGPGTQVQTLPQFLNAANLSRIATAVNQSVTDADGTPIWVDEFNAYSGSDGVDAFPVTYPMVDFTTAGLIEAVTYGAQQFTYFSFDDGFGNYTMVGPNQVPRPAFDLYAGIFKHMAVGNVTTLSTTGNTANIYAMETSAGSDHSLLVANLNTAGTFNLTGLNVNQATTTYTMVDPLQTIQESNGTGMTALQVPALGVTMVDWSTAKPNATLDPAAAIFTEDSIAAGIPNIVILVVVVLGVLAVGVASELGPRRRSSR